MEIEAQVRSYILENFLFTDDESALVNDVSLFDSGTMDSTGVLEMVNFIEETYEIQVEDTDLVPENFETVARIVAYIQRKKG